MGDSDDEAAAIALSLTLHGEPPATAPAAPAPPPDAESGLVAQVMEFAGCSAELARGAVAAAGTGPDALELAVTLALSGDVQQPVGPHKAVCLVRRDLGMGAGKVAAQVAHAALGVYRLATERCPDVLGHWVGDGEAIIVLGVDSVAEMKTLLATAAAHGLCTYCVADAGRTQVSAGTETVGCIGPAPVHKIDVVTGHLSLL